MADAEPRTRGSVGYRTCSWADRPREAGDRGAVRQTTNDTDVRDPPPA